MLLDEKEIRTRMESPMNLLNRLRSLTNPHKTNIIPALPPTADQLISDLDDKLSGTSKDKATKLLNSAMDELHRRLPEVTKAEKLATIAESMSKVVDRVTPARQTAEDSRAPQIIIYAPIVAKEESFDIIDIGET